MLLLSVVLSASALAQEPPPRFPAAAEIVRIDAVVVDASGRPVTDLTAADFEVEESGRPREIASFEAIVVRSADAPPEPDGPASVSVPHALEPQEGRALLVYFDDIHVSPPSAEWVRRNLGPLLVRELRPGDAVTIVAPHGNFWWTARTPWEHAQLPAVIARLKGQYTRDPFRSPIPGHTIRDPMGTMQRAQHGMSLTRIRRTLNGLERAIESLEGFRGRKSIVIYTEGFILDRDLVDYQRIVDQCRRANVALSVADPRGLEATIGLAPGTALEGETAGATHIAAATGGRRFSANDATEAVRLVLEESKAYYLIGFQPAEGRPGERKVAVRVRRDGLRVRARDRYYRGDRLRRETHDPAPVVALRAMSDRTDVRFEVRATTGATSGAGPAPVRLELEFPAPGQERRLSLLVEARPLATGEKVHDDDSLTLPRSDAPQRVERELRLLPGVWQARVVVTDEETGAVGSALHTFEVPQR